MNNYPVAVGKIVDDYLERVKSQLRLVPAREQEDFLREIQSHVYEAYQQTPVEDDVARILAVVPCRKSCAHPKSLQTRSPLRRRIDWLRQFCSRSGGRFDGDR